MPALVAGIHVLLFEFVARVSVAKPGADLTVNAIPRLHPDFAALDPGYLLKPCIVDQRDKVVQDMGDDQRP